jgi:hypothetical protein
MSNNPSPAFEQLARDFLEHHPSLGHVWRPIRDGRWGDRLDLVLAPYSASVPEVWASLLDGQIAVGAGDSHTDFESFGRHMSDDQVGAEAFAHFVDLLRQHGYLTD